VALACQCHKFPPGVTEQERSWQVFDLKLLAIVLAFEEWRAWLMGTSVPVKVYLDHSNLLYFKTAKYLSPQQAQWAAFLDMFNMSIFHIAGAKNLADAPSRRGDYKGDLKLRSDTLTLVEKLALADGKLVIDGVHDLYFQRPSLDFINYLQQTYTDEDKTDKYVLMKNDLFWHQDRIYIPCSLRIQIMRMYHDAPTMGHLGIARTLLIITQLFSWPGIRNDIFDYIKTCYSCQQVKAKRSLKTGKLIFLVPGPRPWSKIGMDMITKLPQSSGYNSVLVVVDFLSKMSHFIPCKEAASASTLANLFCKHIFRIHGLPDKIISDRESTFVSKFRQVLMNLLNIKSALSTAYHLQTDGQTEQTNQTLEDYLRHFCSYYQDNWDKCLDMAKFALNNLDSTSLKISPFFFCYGHHPKFNILTEHTGRPGLDDFFTDLQLTQETAMECLIQARRLQAHYYNKGRQDLPSFEKGDEVLLLRKFIQTCRINSRLD
jgi:hypothetical protein